MGKKAATKNRAGTASEEEKPETPWNPESLKGIDAAKNEQKAARYLGYTDLGEFRRWQCTHPFLERWFAFKNIVKSRSFRSAGVFKTLSSAKSRGELKNMFGGTLDDLIKRYEVKGPSNLDDSVKALARQNQTAGIIYHLVHADIPFDGETQKIIKTEEWMSRYHEVLPDITAATATPKWGPLEGESWGEPYNRAIIAIQIFDTNFAKWNERQGKPGGLNARKIPDTFAPKFMLHPRTESEGEGGGEFPGLVQREPVEVLSQKKLLVYWADPIAVKETFEETHGRIPDSKTEAYDLRSCSASEWRDKIRAEYEFEKLGVNFASLSFNYNENDMDQNMDMLGCNWSDMQALFDRLDQSQISIVKFKTRPLQPNELVRESTGIPRALKSYVTFTSTGQIEAVAPPAPLEQPIPPEDSKQKDMLNKSSTAIPSTSEEIPGQGNVLDQPSHEPTIKPAETPKKPMETPAYQTPKQTRSAMKAAQEKVEGTKNDKYIKETLSKIANRTGRRSDPTSGPGAPDPKKAYKATQRGEMLTEHEGVNVMDPQLRKEWTKKMLQKHGAGQISKTSEPIDQRVMELAGATSALDEEDSKGKRKQSNKEKETAFYRLNAALASGTKQAGPDVHLCAIVLGCNEDPPDGKGRLRTNLLDKEIYLYPWQINGVVDLLLKLLTFVPMRGRSPQMKAHVEKPEVIHACEKLMGLPISEEGKVRSAAVFSKQKYIDQSNILATAGAFLADQTGLGKTIMVLFLLSWLAENHIHPEGRNQPSLVVCPTMLVEAWALEAHTRFPNLKLAIMYADTKAFSHPSLSSKEIPTAFTKALPDLKGCPSWLKPAFENKNKRNPWLIISSIDTFSTRTVSAEVDKDREKVEMKYKGKDGEEKTRWVFPKKWVSNMRKMFTLVAMDEGHKYKNKLTQAWYSIHGLRAPWNLIISATPAISSIYDIVGLLALLWKSYFKADLTDEERDSVAQMDNEELFEFLDCLDEVDPRRRLALEPKKIKNILDKGTLKVSKLFHIAEDLVMLKRNSSSVLPYSTRPDGRLEMQHFYPEWSVNTIRATHRPDEAEEFQLYHLLAARAYYDFIERFTRGDEDAFPAPGPGDAPGPQPKKRKAFPTAPLRELAIVTCSTKLARLHYQLKNAGLNTKVVFMNQLRDKGLGADFLAVMTYEHGDPVYTTRNGLLAFLTHGSPKLRILYSEVYKTCYELNSKLLVIEDIPICAKFYEDSVRALWIHCEVLHSKLNHKQRAKLLDDFNDPSSSLKVLIIMVDVASQGLNLQKASYRVLTMCPAKKSNPQVQAENRPLRVDQEHAVEIMRIILGNSHDPWREARQTSSIRLEIATKAHLPEMRIELVRVLNEFQVTLNEMKETENAKRLMDIPDVDEIVEDDRPVTPPGLVQESPQLDRTDGLEDQSESLPVTPTPAAAKLRLEVDGRHEFRDPRESPATTGTSPGQVQPLPQYDGADERSNESSEVKTGFSGAETPELIAQEDGDSASSDEADEGGLALEEPNQDDAGAEPKETSDQPNEGDHSDANYNEPSEEDSEEESEEFEEESEEGSEEEFDEDSEPEDVVFQDEDELPDFLKMSPEEREDFDQDEFFLRQLLKWRSDYVYTETDLENERILNRAIDLLHHKRQGQNGVTRVVSVHINYDALSDDLRTAATTEKNFAIAKDGKIRLDQKKQAMASLNLTWKKQERGEEEVVEPRKERGRPSASKSTGVKTKKSSGKQEVGGNTGNARKGGREKADDKKGNKKRSAPEGGEPRPKRKNGKHS